MSTFLSILPIIIALVLYFTGIPIAYALFAAALIQLKNSVKTDTMTSRMPRYFV